MAQKPLFLIGSIFLLSLIGAEVLLFTKVVDPPWNPFRPTPEQVLFAAFQNFQNVDTYRSSQQMFVTAKADERTLKLTVISNGSADQADPQNLQAQGSFGLDVAVSSYGESVAISLKGDVRAIGDVLYLNLVEMDLPPEFAEIFTLIGIDPAVLKNQWIRIDAKELVESSGQDYAEQLELQQQLQENLKAVLLSEDLYVIEEELADEKIGDLAAYHYIATINLEGMFLAVMDVVFEAAQEQYAEEYGEDGGFSSDVMMGAAKGAAQEFIKKIGDIDFEIWIDKKDLLPLSIKVDKNIDLTVFDESLEGFVNFSTQTDFTEYNESVSVEAPPDSKSFQELLPEELLQAVFPYSLYPSPSVVNSNTNARIISDTAPKSS